MNLKSLSRILAAGCLSAAFLTGLQAFPVYAEEAAQTVEYDALKTSLETAGFTVQQGSFYELDTIKEASEGRLMSCFGNNAGSSYMVFQLPNSPDQEVANPPFLPQGWQYKLRQDEAIVLITPLPPQCKYYSFTNYLMFTEVKDGKDYSAEKSFFTTGDETTGIYHPIFGSIGDPLNMQRIQHDGDSPYGSTAAIVISANQTVTDTVITQLHEAGYDDSMINVMEIPEMTYKMGLEKGDDTFCFLGRISQPEDQDAYEQYLSSLAEDSIVYRITPTEEISSAPYDNAVVTPRGTGRHESADMDQAEEHLSEIRSAMIAQYQDEYDYEELKSDIAVPEGLTAYFNDTNSLGDNRDTTYLMTPDFTFNSDEDFVVVYGVNHTLTGKAQYSNAVLYARPMLNGVSSVYDSLFEGSADAYLEDGCEDSDQYYVYKLARTEMDEYTAVVEYSTDNEKGKFYGVDNGSPMLMAFRAYLDETGTGASYNELIYDRTIVFHKK